MDVVTVSDLVMARKKGGALPPMRWAVVATFARHGSGELRCVDYRVRVVPETSRPGDSVKAGHKVARQMLSAAPTVEEVERLGSIPPEGIPRRVFEEASQAKLLAKARAKATRRPDRVSPATRRALHAIDSRGVGRPPSRSMAEKLRTLADAEAGFGAGETRAEIAARNAMSDSSLRDLLTWARRNASPPLWVSNGPGRRGGALTPEARSMLAELTKGNDDGER